MANKQDHADKDPDICQPLPEKNSPNTLDGQGEQQRPLGKNTLSPNRDRDP